ncbi:MAG: arsenosugar biosynthesis radical SAM protein ArsS [Candidatus Dadabacteria bacterium]|nr:arsenosugar biosynthesis radical SAM protein ArsS [Candidatus Dadabacteria bacterium]
MTEHNGSNGGGRNFSAFIKDRNVSITPRSLKTLQVNVTKLCNQACVHCHVDASPKRTEQMDIKTINRCLEILSDEKVETLDITGGAPELNPHFDHLVRRAAEMGKHIIVRHNLTVTFDGNPVTGESKEYLPEFFARHGVEVVSSLPHYDEYFTDKQRGRGVFEKSVRSALLLNEQGYGGEGSGLVLNFVHNPPGEYLPSEQTGLEKTFKEKLKSRHGIEFNNLYCITNMPINRFRQWLIRENKYSSYMDKIVSAFNPSAAEGVMCRDMISVDHNGNLYDCDFNQMLGMGVPAENGGGGATVFNSSHESIVGRDIKFGSHCFGCTAGGGSSCGGQTA